MKTLNEIIAELKKEYPTLQKGNEVDGYESLNTKEYDETITFWAANLFEKQNAQAELEAKTTAKAELLNRLGITEDEAKLLLA